MIGRVAMDAAERQRRSRANNPANAAENKRRYRHDNSKWETNVSYLSRPFVAWDGEGVTVKREHKYVMFAGKGDGGSTYIDNEHGLATVTIFDTLLEYAEKHPTAIHVIYGGGYDFNMWLREFAYVELRHVYERAFYTWNGYRIGWRRGKSFYLCRVDENGDKIGRGITVYDVVSFFQCPFVKACDEYLGDKFAHRDMIVENKALRSGFGLDDIAQVREYNDAELDNLLSLMVELRIRLNNAGLRPRRWDGPGAVAAVLMQRENVKDAMVECPEGVRSAARYAYAGGRFEVIKFGHVERNAYEYDVNSAYPNALRNVPNLARGSWRHVQGDPGVHRFALYHIDSQAFRDDVPAPLFRRDENGTICYPQSVVGWYWTPERVSCDAYCDAGWGQRRVLDAWVFTPDVGVDSPFEFIEGLYKKRRALKKAGDGAHVGIKLALNSLYGKMAQQVGWGIKPDGSLRIPPFHQLEYAGYATSHCRMMVLLAALKNLRSVIAFETDALFTTTPIDVAMGSDLGEFEVTEFRDLTYLQSGMYFGTKIDGETISKTRGVDRGELTRDGVLERFVEPLAENRKATAKLTRFVGAGIALSQSFKKWRTWDVMTKRLTLEPTGKRIHIECAACTANGLGLGEWHITMCPMLSKEHSAEFPIAWLNPNPAMIELEELRENGYDDDYDQ